MSDVVRQLWSHGPHWRLLLETGLLALLCATDAMNGLLVRKRTALGRAYSRFFLVMAVTWQSALLLPVWSGVFGSDAWYFTLRFLLIGSAFYALRALILSVGGLSESLRVVWGEHRPVLVVFVAVNLAALVVWVAAILSLPAE